MSPGLDEVPSPAAASSGPTFWLTRFVILRWLGLVLNESPKWKECQFKGQPVDLNRRPPFVAPHQLRLDW